MKDSIAVTSLIAVKGFSQVTSMKWKKAGTGDLSKSLSRVNEALLAVT